MSTCKYTVRVRAAIPVAFAVRVLARSSSQAVRLPLAVAERALGHYYGDGDMAMTMTTLLLLQGLLHEHVWAR